MFVANTVDAVVAGETETIVCVAMPQTAKAIGVILIFSWPES
jgi:hypothetical protein